MANVHGLYSNKKDDDDSDDEKDESNNRYVGGIGSHGGGSGLAVEPSHDEMPPAGSRDAVFGLAQNAGTVGEGEQIRRTITMYRDGFTVDDGPYRRLDDPENAAFLRSLAMGRTPQELTEEDGGNIVVGLVDKRSQEYVETFQTFSGTGASLGTTTRTANAGGVFDPASLPVVESTTTSSTSTTTTTSIAVRLLNGKRKVVQIALTATVTDLAAQLRDEAAGTAFRLVAGFPPKPLEDATATIADAGLKGAQVSMQKA